MDKKSSGTKIRDNNKDPLNQQKGRANIHPLTRKTEQLRRIIINKYKEYMYKYKVCIYIFTI